MLCYAMHCYAMLDYTIRYDTWRKIKGHRVKGHRQKNENKKQKQKHGCCWPVRPNLQVGWAWVEPDNRSSIVPTRSQNSLRGKSPGKVPRLFAIAPSSAKTTNHVGAMWATA